MQQRMQFDSSAGSEGRENNVELHVRDGPGTLSTVALKPCPESALHATAATHGHIVGMPSATPTVPSEPALGVKSDRGESPHITLFITLAQLSLLTLNSILGVWGSCQHHALFRCKYY